MRLFKHCWNSIVRRALVLCPCVLLERGVGSSVWPIEFRSVECLRSAEMFLDSFRVAFLTGVLLLRYFFRSETASIYSI